MVIVLAMFTGARQRLSVDAGFLWFLLVGLAIVISSQPITEDQNFTLSCHCRWIVLSDGFIKIVLSEIRILINLHQVCAFRNFRRSKDLTVKIGASEQVLCLGVPCIRGLLCRSQVSHRLYVGECQLRGLRT